MIAMGSVYLHDCPQGEYIPIYLLIGGEWFNAYIFFNMPKFIKICWYPTFVQIGNKI
jgi:hypothetical protein